MKLWRKMNDWLAWRGIMWNDIVYAIGAFSVIIAIISMTIASLLS